MTSCRKKKKITDFEPLREALRVREVTGALTGIVGIDVYNDLAKKYLRAFLIRRLLDVALQQWVVCGGSTIDH